MAERRIDEDASAHDWRDALASHGRARLSLPLQPDDLLAPSDGDGWRERRAEHAWFDQAAVDEDQARRIEDVFAASSLTLAEAPLWMRHDAGRFGAPAFAGPLGFVLDVNAGWRASWGGLLLFGDEDGRLEGWRPERGALTLFDVTRPPVLTLVTPLAGAARLALVGDLRAPGSA